MSTQGMLELYWMVEMGSNDKIITIKSDVNYHISEKPSHLLSWSLISREVDDE